MTLENKPYQPAAAMNKENKSEAVEILQFLPFDSRLNHLPLSQLKTALQRFQRGGKEALRDYFLQLEWLQKHPLN